MMMLLTLLACMLLGIAAYNLTCAFVDVPTSKTSKMMMLSQKQQGIKSEKLFDVYITRIASKLERYVKLDKLRRNKLQSVLDIAGIKLSPEVYVLKAYVKSALIALCAIPAGLVMPLFIPILIALAVALWFSSYYSAFDFVKKRKKRLEAEIPRFALTITQSLENDRDVLRILTSYRRVAGKEFGAELDQTIADMKTGNYENALIRFESRVGSTLLSDVIRGLIGTLRGDDQRMYFKMICFDMRQIEQNLLKKEAAKRPPKMQRYSMLMLICIIIIYLVVLSTEVIGSLGVFFG
jgi:CHASE3 domain sensor protein